MSSDDAGLEKRRTALRQFLLGQTKEKPAGVNHI
jgi:hypothetical protein